MNKAIAIIPARGGSKRLPGKNLKMLGNLPLLAHSIRYALANPEIIAEVYVSTDDASIAKTAAFYGATVIQRPSAISGDLEPTVSALQHVLEVSRTSATTVVLLQPTNPLRPAGLLQDAYGQFCDSNSSSLFTVSRHAHKLGRIKNDRFLPFNYEPGQRSQELEPLYFENGLLYISSAELILDGAVMGSDGLPFIVDHPFGNADIDTEDDFAYAEFLFHKFNP